MNNNKKKAHKLIGEATIAIADVQENVFSEMDLALKSAGKPAGSLKLRITKKIAPKKPAENTKALSPEVSTSREVGGKSEQPLQKEKEDEGCVIPELLALEVIKGIGLKKVQRIGSQDPYIKATVGKEVKKTGVAKGTNPVWKSAVLKLNLSEVSSSSEELKLEVLDAETVMKDRIIGTWTKTLDAFLDENQGQEQQLNLVDPKGKNAGALVVRLLEPTVKTSKEGDSSTTKARSLEPPSEKSREVNPEALPKAGTTPKDTEEQRAALGPGNLRLTVLKGVRLKKVQMVGKQDPYVVAKLLPWEITAPKTKCASGVNPVWSTGNVLEFDYPGKLASTSVQVTVFDAELVMKDRLIGSGEIQDVRNAVSDSRPIEIALKDAKGKPAGTLHVQVDFQESEVKVTSRRQLLQKSGTLLLAQLKANLTRSVEMLSKQDPLLEAAILPWAGPKQVAKTKTLRNAGKQCDWKDESIQLYYPGKPTSGETPLLRIRVYDDESLSKDRLIGEGIVELYEDTLSSADIQVPLSFKNSSAGSANLHLTFNEGQEIEEASLDIYEIPASDEQAKTRPENLEAAGDVFVRVEKAHGLLNRAFFGKQDPYVRATLLPWGETCRTREVTDGGTAVEFLDKHGKQLRLKYIGGQLPESPTLLLQVFDQQLGQDRLIGERHLGTSCFLGQPQQLAIPLLNKKKSAGILEVEAKFRKRGASRGCLPGKLKVEVVSVSLSHGDDLWSKCDPYVSLTPHPSTIESRRYTSVVRANAGVAAAFREVVEVPLFDFDDSGPSSSLRVEVFDRDTITKDDLLGSGLLELEEVLAGEAGDRPLEVALRMGKKDVGHVLLRIKFVPSPFAGDKLQEALGKGQGFLRVWALEARQLKHVTGLMDFKMDPYLAVYFQDPGATVPSKFKLQTKAANDAGESCVWNTPIDVPFSSSNAAWAAAGQIPGFLHIAVFDANLLGDKLVGRKVVDVLKPHGDTWITLMDSKGNKAGEVRIALDFALEPPAEDLKASAIDRALVPPGKLHLFIGRLSGVPPQLVPSATLELRLGGQKAVNYEPQVNQDGTIQWTQLCDIQWGGHDTTSTPHQLATLEAVVKYKKSRVFGSAEIPLAAFIRDASSAAFQHSLPVRKPGSAWKDTHACLAMTGVFIPAEDSALSKPSNRTGRSEDLSILPSLKVYNTEEPAPEEISVKPLSGRLHIVVLEAQKLKAGGSWIGGKADPYIRGELRPGGTVFRTDTCRDGGRSAKWTSAMRNANELLVADANSAVVEISCMDEDDLSSDDRLGRVVIPVQTVARWMTKAKQEVLEKHAEARENEVAVWWKLLEGKDGIDEKNELIQRIKRTLETPKWQEWCRKAFRSYMEVSSGHEGEESEAERNASRAAKLRDFYQSHSDLSEEEIEKKVAKINASANNEPTNKVLWHRLYQKYKVSEACPDSLWQEAFRHLRHEASEPLPLTAEVIGDVVDYVDSRVNAVIGRQGDTAVSEEGLANVEDDLTSSECMLKAHSVLDATAFEAIAQTVMAEAIIEDFTSSKHSSSSEDSHGLNEDEADPDGSKTLWWDLLDKQGQKVVGSVKLQMWFTDDWIPPSRETVPLALLQEGEIWMEVNSASVHAALGKQDLYVRFSFSCAKSSEVFKREAKTPVAKKSGGEGVEWPADGRQLRLNYDATAAHCLTTRGQTPLLHIELLDKDSLTADDLIGETLLPLLPFATHPNRIFGRPVDLINTRSGETTRAATLSLRMQFLQSDGEGALRPFEGETSGEEDLVPIRGEISVDVGSARGMKGVDRGGAVAVLRLWPSNEVTATKAAEGAAVWKERLVMSAVDVSMSTLEVTLKRNKKELGALTMCLQDLLTGPIEGWFELFNRKTGEGCGEIQIAAILDRHEQGEEARGTAVRFVEGPGALHMKVLRASGLKSVVLRGTQDPFVQIKAVRWRSGFETKSEVDENGGKNPSFMFGATGKLEWDPKDKDCPSILLEIKHSGMMSASPIGKAILPIAAWILCPAQVTSLWLPVDSGGTVELMLQYLPDAAFKGKPSRPLRWAGSSSGWPPKGDVHVQVLSARNLVNVESFGKQDPYVKLSLWMGGGSGKCRVEMAKSRAIEQGGSNPKWGEDLLLPYVREEGSNWSTPVLEIELLDKNKLKGDRSIGRAIMPIFPFILEDGQVVDQWFPLVRSNGIQSGQIHLGVQFRREGEGKRLLASESPENVLNVVILRGYGLAETEARQDPQVWVEFIGHDHVVKTAVASNQGSEPVFDERVNLPGCRPDERGVLPRLRCTVVDIDSLSSSDLIGVAEVSLTQKVMDGEAVQMDLPLHDLAGQLSKGTLQVILKRGPFPGDIDDSVEASNERKVMLHVEEVADLVTPQGRPPSGKIFIRITSHRTKRDSCETKARAFTSVEGGLVVPAPPAENKQAVTLAVYSRKWGLMGFKPSLLGKAVVGLKSELEEVQLDLPIRLEEAGASLGRLRGKLQVVPLISGHFRILVGGVANIARREVIGKNDLRVDVFVANSGKKSSGAERVCTSVKQNTGPCADFQETLSLAYSNQAETSLPHVVLKVVEVDTLSTTCCGSVSIPVQALVVDGFKAGMGGASKMETTQYALDEGKGTGTVEASIEFIPDSSLFTQSVAEESRATMELKRMWNLVDANGDGCLSIDELRTAVETNKDCVAYLGSSDGDALFKEMNANGDDIIDFQEFRQFIESKPARDKAKKEARWRREQAQEAERFRLEQAREARLRAERARKQDELAAKMKMEKERKAKARAAERKKASDAARRREEELAQAALKRQEKELARMEKVMAGADRPENHAKKKAAKKPRQRPESVMQWRTRDVVEWIVNDLDLPEHAGAFAEGAVDGPLLVNLTNDDLRTLLNVQVELHRRKILLRAQGLVGEKPPQKKRRKPKKSTTHRQADLNSAAIGHGHATKMKLFQGVTAEMKQQEEEEKKKDIDRFEYTSPPKELRLDSPDVFEWFNDDWKSSAQKLSSEEPSSAEEESEEEFRRAMQGVRERIQQKQLLDAGQPFHDPQIDRPISLPDSATDEELVEVIKQKLYEFCERECEGKVPLRRAYKLFCRMRNDTDAASHEHLSRLKFKGALRTLLGIELSWDQLDRVFRRIARGDGSKRGGLSWDDFNLAFRRRGRPGEWPASVERLLFSTCKALVKQRISLKSAFEAFDANGSGWISLSEFSSLIRSVLGHRKKTDDHSKVIYQVFRSIDQDFDRKISLQEFMEYWLKVFRQWTAHLKAKSGGDSAQLRTLIPKIERAMRHTFSQDDSPQKLPGPASSLLRMAAVSPETIDNSFIDMRQSRAETAGTRHRKPGKSNRMVSTGSGHVAARAMRNSRGGARDAGRPNVQIPIRKMRFDPFTGLDVDEEKE